MKGIILAGGNGTRLHPITISVNKQLLPIYDAPLISYPLDVLLQSGIKDILVICKEEDKLRYDNFLNKYLDLKVELIIQDKPNGIAEAFILGEEFIGDEDVALILGDNLFIHSEISNLIKSFDREQIDCILFTKNVTNPNSYGVYNRLGHTIVEKPKNYISNEAVTGFYIFSNLVINYAKKLKPSDRGELEITDLNNIFLEKHKTIIFNLDETDKNCHWLDCGSFEDYYKAFQLIYNLRKQGNNIGRFNS
jgi:glucose-1-phosphate thymidylyltransferase